MTCISVPVEIMLLRNVGFDFSTGWKEQNGYSNLDIEVSEAQDDSGFEIIDLICILSVHIKHVGGIKANNDCAVLG